MDCPLINSCPFFNDKLKDMPSMSNIYKRNYCKKDYIRCARYLVSTTIGKENVPLDIFPNHEGKAKEIIKNFKKQFLLILIKIIVSNNKQY